MDTHLCQGINTDALEMFMLFEPDLSLRNSPTFWETLLLTSSPGVKMTGLYSALKYVLVNMMLQPTAG